jgi:hypothetical protein
VIAPRPPAPAGVAGHSFYSDGTCGRCGVQLADLRERARQERYGFPLCRRRPGREPAGSLLVYDWLREGDFLGFPAPLAS